MQTINVNNEEYEVVKDEARALTVHLIDLFHKLGLSAEITNEDLTSTVWKFIERLVQVWKVGYPDEYIDWVDGLTYELKYERPIKQAIKAGGYTPIAYPMRVYSLMHVFLPKVKMQEKKFIKSFLQVLPEFKHTRYKI